MVILVKIWATTSYVDDADMREYSDIRPERVETRAHVDALVKAFEKRSNQTFLYVCVSNHTTGDTLYESEIPGEQPEWYSSELTA